MEWQKVTYQHNQLLTCYLKNRWNYGEKKKIKKAMVFHDFHYNSKEKNNC